MFITFELEIEALEATIPKPNVFVFFIFIFPSFIKSFSKAQAPITLFVVFETLSTLIFNLFIIIDVPLKYPPIPTPLVDPIYFTFIVPVEVVVFSK